MDNSLISVMKKWWCFQGGKGIFSEYFGTERVAENYTKLGTYIKRQLHKDLIQYRAALSEQKAKLGQIILILVPQREATKSYFPLKH